MKIEKISDTQVKFVLNKADLQQRDIKITELAYGSEKVQELFREIMDQASEECGFETENGPLMIEAIPITIDSIMIIVTKVSGNEDTDNKFSLIPRALDQGKFKKKQFIDSNEENNSNANIFIYSLKSIDDAMCLSSRLADSYSGGSSLYKYENNYFMIFEKANYDDSHKSFEAVLNEYGRKHIAGVISKYHIIEHGEVIIGESAVQVLSGI